jgi:hypothetical protein
MTGLWGRVAAVPVRVGMRGLDTYDRLYQTEGKTEGCGEPVAANLHGGIGGGDAETCAPQGVRERRVPIQSVRERLATLTRKCRHTAHRLQGLETGMYLIGSTYNFCCFHQELSTRAAGEVHRRLRQTPAMASGLTDHLWSLAELLRYKVAPAPWVEQKRRGRPRRGPRKIPLSTFTVSWAVPVLTRPKSNFF